MEVAAQKKSKRRKGQDEEDANTTVSIAVAGCIIDNAQSPELATRLAGQIARAATIFRIDEGLLPPLDAPHHARKHEWILYREGVTLDRKSPAGFGTFVDVGLCKAVFIQQTIKPGLRVTVSMGSSKSLEADCVRQAVKHSEPREKMGFYWGYKVRYASTIGNVFKESPYKGGYDYSIGTSEHGDIVRSADLVIPKFRHLLIAFGGLGGLEENIEEDKNLKGKDVRQLFNCYLNTCPNQGSRTIRTEEAALISLQYFQDPIQRATSS